MSLTVDVVMRCRNEMPYAQKALAALASQRTVKDIDNLEVAERLNAVEAGLRQIVREVNL